MRIIRLLARIMVKALKWLCLGAIVIVHYSCRLMLKILPYIANATEMAIEKMVEVV